MARSLLQLLALVLLAAPMGATEPATAGAVATARAERAAQMTKLRAAYAASPQYHPYDTESRELVASAREHLAKKKSARAIADAQKGLKNAPFNIDLLVVLELAYRDAGESTKADETNARWKSIVDSILETGDGRSFDTAFQVIDIADEYAVIRAMQLTPAGQSLNSNGRAMFDVIKVTSPKTGETFELYFNINLPMNWMNRQFATQR